LTPAASTEARLVTTTVIIAGVSGVGKSAVAAALGARLGWPWVDGDDFHSEENKSRMRAGIALTDGDRWPWLASIATWIGRNETVGRNGIVACSALRRRYRDRLRRGHSSVWFAFLLANQATVAARLAERKHEFMAPSLLASQIAALEPLDAAEDGMTLPADLDASAIVETIVEALLSRR
jgi:gluconokinase